MFCFPAGRISVCLAWALQQFSRVETIGFDYGQRHAIELTVRARLRERMAALRADWKAGLGDDHLVKLDALAAISETALTRNTAIEMADSGLPTTFVPGRNLIFSALQAHWPTGVARAIWWPACARPITRAIPIVEMTP